MALDLLGGTESFGFGLGDVALEVGIGAELLDGGASLGVTKEVLGEEDDEGLAEVAVDLTTEGVAVVQEE
jgi:hypothetical protein